ncbi:MAG TPA: HAD family phosphatase [Thermoanaerobaculia bacterium]|nr:HAD family phosphatase [Thermoanaerobaculia bacterium]
MLRAVVFDFNGVLIDDEPVHLAVFQRVLAEEGIELTRDEYLACHLGHDDRRIFAAVLADRGQGADAARLARLVARKSAYYQEHVHRQGYPFFAGAAELVVAAAERGWVLALVSGAPRDEVEGALAAGGLAGRFKVTVTAEDVEVGKPDPAGYLLAIAALNSQPPLPARLIHPHEVLAVEDSPAGLEAATAAGFVTLALAHSHAPQGLARAGAVLPSIDGLTADDLEAAYRRAVGEI